MSRGSERNAYQALSDRALVTEFHHYLVRRRHVSESTAADYERGLKRLERLAGLPRTHLDAAALEEFLGEELSWSTKNQTLVAFRTWHRWGARRGYWALDPEIEEIQAPRRRQEPTLPLSAQEALALIGAAQNPIERRWIYLGLFAGLRLAEMVFVQPSSWTNGSEAPRLRVLGKGQVWREVPIHPALEGVRNLVLPFPCGRRAIQGTYRHLREEVKVPHLTARTLRRTFSDTLSRAGVEREVIGSLLGHSPNGVTERHYAPVRWQERVDAIARLTYSGDGPGL